MIAGTIIVKSVGGTDRHISEHVTAAGGDSTVSGRHYEAKRISFTDKTARVVDIP